MTDILSHELIHYYLWKHNKPHDDDDIEFYALTYQRGISRTCTTIVKDGVLKYEYNKHACKCKCGYKIDTYLQVIDNNFCPTLVCPDCGKYLVYDYCGAEYLDYIPTFSVKMNVDCWLKHKKC